MKKEKIILNVELDDSNIPSGISWQNSDQGGAGTTTEAKAFLLSLFDKSNKETLKIDLWTKEMQVSEMDRLMYYTLKGLADTYKKATRNETLGDDLAHFAKYFGEKTEILAG